MATIGIKVSAWDGARDNQRAILRYGVKRLALGHPARYLDGTSTEWFIFDDHRIDLRQVALLGTLVAGLAVLPVGWTAPMLPDGSIDRDATEALVEDYVKDRVVWPTDITYTHMVDHVVPVMEYREFPVLDEEGIPTGETYWRWVDSGVTQVIQVEEPLPNPWQITLDAQGAPAAIRAAGNVPEAWTPVDVEVV